MGRRRSRYFWEQALRYSTKAVHVNKQEEDFKLFREIFPYFLEGTCTKRKCAVSHTFLQIGGEADFANDQKQAEHLWCLGY